MTKALIKEIKLACDKKGIEFIMTFMSEHQRNSDLKDYCQSIKVNTLNVSIDFKDPEMTNFPYDHYPSPEAHLLTANKIIPYLKSYVWKTTAE